MREYAGLKLRESGGGEGVPRRNIDYFPSRCLRVAPQARYGLVEWLEWMDLEIDNVRSVLQQCLDRGEFVRGIELASSVGWYWITRATTEGVRWLDELLGSAGGGPQSYAPGYFMRGFLSVLKADPTAARPALAHAVTAARAAGQLRVLAESLSMASVAEAFAGDRASAGRLLDEAQNVIAGLNDHSATLSVLQARALRGLFEADLNEGRSAAPGGRLPSRKGGALT